MFLLDDNNFRYTWKKEWVWKYESFWGVTQKFKYFNCLNKMDWKYFNIKTGTSEMQDLYNFIIRSKMIYNPQEYSNHFGITSNHYDYIRPLRHNPLENYINNTLKVCPICIKYGYHSYFHQFIFEKTCFIHHKVKLVETGGMYCIKNNSSTAFADVINANIFVHNSDDVLINTIYNKNFFAKAYSISTALQSISIINLNSRKDLRNVNLKMPDELCKYLHNIYWGKKFTNKPLYVINKYEMEEQWTSYNYTIPNYKYSEQFPISRNGLFTDYCYEYADELYNLVNKDIIMVS